MILIVGAGAAGLATAYYLQQRGLDYCILEKDRPGATWHHHYARLHLHTLKQVSGLPGLPMPAHYPRFPSAAQVQAYLQAYAQHFQLKVEPGVTVLHAAYTADGWQVQTDNGLFHGTTLIAATGIWNTPHRPRFGGEEQFGGCIMHSSTYHNAVPFQGQRVLVVGVGNSGAEIAVDLSENGITTGIAIRGGANFVPYPRSAPLMRLLAWLCRHAPPALVEQVLLRLRRNFATIGIPPHAAGPLDVAPVVGYELPEAVAAGHVTVYRGLTHFLPGGVCFAAGQVVPFDAVILATGYRPTLHFVQHELAFDQRGFPRLHNWRSTRNPHLYCIGFQYPTIEGWLQAIGRVAQQAVTELAYNIVAPPP